MFSDSSIIFLFYITIIRNSCIFTAEIFTYKEFMCKEEMSTNQLAIFNEFRRKFVNNSKVVIVNQKSRISFKLVNSRLNYFILFCYQDGFYLHLNERRMNSENIMKGFKTSCFNSAKRYQQCEIKNLNDAENAIKLIKNNINF